MKLFEYAILYHPRQKKTDSDEGLPLLPSAILVGPKAVVARDQSEVNIIAARTIPSDYAEKLNQIEIVVRPF